MIKYHELRQLKKERAYFGLFFQRERSPSLRGNMAARARSGGRNKKLRGPIWNHRHKAERADEKWGKVVILLSILSDTLPPANFHLHNSTKNSSNWNPSAQIHEPMGTFIIQTTAAFPTWVDSCRLQGNRIMRLEICSVGFLPTGLAWTGSIIG